MKTNDDNVLYRATDGIFDEGGEVSIMFQTFHILKRTPRGQWICPSLFSTKRRWVSNYTRKRFAHPTKEEALQALKKRKEVQLYYLDWTARIARRVIKLIERGKLEEY